MFGATMERSKRISRMPGPLTHLWLHGPRTNLKMTHSNHIFPILGYYCCTVFATVGTYWLLSINSLYFSICYALRHDLFPRAGCRCHWFLVLLRNTLAITILLAEYSSRPMVTIHSNTLQLLWVCALSYGEGDKSHKSGLLIQSSTQVERSSCV